MTKGPKGMVLSESDIIQRELFLMGWLARKDCSTRRLHSWCTLHGALFVDISHCSCTTTVYTRLLTVDGISNACVQVILDGRSVACEYDGVARWGGNDGENRARYRVE